MPAPRNLPRRRLLSGLACACLLAGLALRQIEAQTGKNLLDRARQAAGQFQREAQRQLEFKQLGTISDRRIAESSGIAASRLQPGVFWTHNDSGDGPYLYAIDRKGRTLARLRVTGARHVDWEDIAIGPGAGGRPALYIGDIGDNSAQRREAVVYRIPEPRLAPGKTGQELTSEPCESLPFRYPDGARNAETLMAHPTTGEVVIVTKASSGNSAVYAFPLPLSPGERVTLKQIAALTFTSVFPGRLGRAEKLTTGGDIAPNGKRLVIRTYTSAYEWKLTPGQTLAAVFRQRPQQHPLPITGIGEAICYRHDSKAWLITAEGAGAWLCELSLP